MSNPHIYIWRLKKTKFSKLFWLMKLPFTITNESYFIKCSSVGHKRFNDKTIRYCSKDVHDAKEYKFG